MSRIPAFGKRALNAFVRLLGSNSVPMRVENTKPLSRHREPAAIRSSSWRMRCDRSAETTTSGKRHGLRLYQMPLLVHSLERCAHVKNLSVEIDGVPAHSSGFSTNTSADDELPSASQMREDSLRKADSCLGVSGPRGTEGNLKMESEPREPRRSGRVR